MAAASAAEAEAVAEAQQEERGAAGEKDEIRVQILHHALESGASAMMISTIIAADPRCVRARDAQRRLPLHVALTRVRHSAYYIFFVYFMTYHYVLLYTYNALTARDCAYS